MTRVEFFIELTENRNTTPSFIKIENAWNSYIFCHRLDIFYCDFGCEFGKKCESIYSIDVSPFLFKHELEELQETNPEYFI